MKKRPAALGATIVASVAPAGTAYTDETHSNPHNAPRASLVQTGQIDDPLEDALEHATVYGTTCVIGCGGPGVPGALGARS